MILRMPPMPSPTLAVVWPNYNHGKYVRQALEGMLSQTRPPDEIVIIDDCSTDDSWEILCELAALHPRIRLYRNEVNRGVVYGINRGLQLTQADYVHFTASDDTILPDFYEKSLRLLAEHPEAGLCSSQSRIVDGDGQLIKIWPGKDLGITEPTYVSPSAAADLMHRYGPWYQGNTSVWRRNAVVEAGGFRHELYALCDGYLFEVVAFRHGAVYFPEAHAVFRVLPQAVSSVMSSEDIPQMERRLALYRAAEKLIYSEHCDVFPAAYIRKTRLRNSHFECVIELTKLKNSPPQAGRWTYAYYKLRHELKRSLLAARIDRPTPLQLTKKAVYRLRMWLQIRTRLRRLVGWSTPASNVCNAAASVTDG